MGDIIPGATGAHLKTVSDKRVGKEIKQQATKLLEQLLELQANP